MPDAVGSVRTRSYRNHGAYLSDAGCEEDQSISLSARYTTGADHYFDWQDADKDDARTLADKFLARFTRLAGQGEGWSYVYAGWYQRLLGLAGRAWIPVVASDYGSFSFSRVTLENHRLPEWRTANDKTPTLPLPPSGKLQEDLKRLRLSMAPASRQAGSNLFVQGFADFAARFAGVRATGAGAEALIASTVVTKRIP